MNELNYFKIMILKYYTFFSFLSYLLLFTPFDTGTIHLEVQNIKPSQGSIKVAIFGTEDEFLVDDKAIQGHSVVANNSDKLTITLKDLPFGTYAIAIYQDLNDNGKLDTNLFGVPKEPYGFSNNARSKWGPPKYEIAKFELNEKVLKINAAVKVWSKQ